ncbi:MAG: DUF1569 domain-containing protein [Chitinophagaceae bacterium]|nr:DUF1569 domain-containing protein [Chitinophagaceae bacterium]
MKSLFDNTACEEILARINQLSPQSTRQWGKMDVAQMLAHSKEAFKVPLSETAIPRMFIGILLGWIFKKKLYNEEPWKQNLPTAPNFIIKDQRNFETEKKELLSLIEKFHSSNPAVIENIVHPMFGRFTGEQWGKAMYKHLDHHLKQFAV